jgi:hypothetical protein
MNEGKVVNLGPVRLRKYAEKHHCAIIVIDEVHREGRDGKGKAPKCDDATKHRVALLLTNADDPHSA